MPVCSDHVEGLQKQLQRTPHKRPTLKIADKPFGTEFEDFSLQDYEHDAFIKFPIAV